MFSARETRTLVFGNNMSHDITIHKWKKQACIVHGWHNYVIQSGVEVGDAMKFEVSLDNPHVWKAYLFKGDD